VFAQWPPLRLSNHNNNNNNNSKKSNAGSNRAHILFESPLSLSQRTSSRCNEAYEQFLKQLKQNSTHAKDFRLKPFYERVFLKLTRQSPMATTTATNDSNNYNSNKSIHHNCPAVLGQS